MIISHFEKQSDHDNFGNSPKSEVLIEAINPLFQLSEPYDEMCGSRCLFKNHDTFSLLIFLNCNEKIRNINEIDF